MISDASWNDVSAWRTQSTYRINEVLGDAVVPHLSVSTIVHAASKAMHAKLADESLSPEHHKLLSFAEQAWCAELDLSVNGHTHEMLMDAAADLTNDVVDEAYSSMDVVDDICLLASWLSDATSGAEALSRMHVLFDYIATVVRRTEQV